MNQGFDCMGGRSATSYNTSNDRFLLKYAIARLASYRNLWWSMADEFNAIQCKTPTIWDELFAAMMQYDPYDGLDGREPVREKSILQRGNVLYNYSQPFLTHFSVQGFANSNYRYFWDRFNVSKPVVLDKVDYEGNISKTSGNDLSATEETDRFWMANSNGNMCGHSESLLPNKTDDIDGTALIWNNFGNVLRGGSYDKIGWFFRYMLNVAIHPPFATMDSLCLKGTDAHCLISSLQRENAFYLIHWSNYSNGGYDTKLVHSLGDALYQLSYVDFMEESIQTLNKSINGTTFEFKPPYIPYNIQLVNVKSPFHQN